MDLAEGSILAEFWRIRHHTDALCANLTPEDQCIQSMPDASPAKWHRAHTTWFFEQFVLQIHLPGYVPFSPEFSYLFNSYYDAVGERQPRFARGMITRPSSLEIGDYRAHVDAAMATLLTSGADIGALVMLGLQHEQQHQELLVTDILHASSLNPLLPSMMPNWTIPASASIADSFVPFEGGIVQIGHDGNGFSFDNEGPQHRVLLQPFTLGSRLVRNGAWLEFMADRGYTTPALWMSEGWSTVWDRGWKAPQYWFERDGAWTMLTPAGEVEVDRSQPVRHVSWYEADAFARWAGKRLPTEFEWETACKNPCLHEMTDQVWQWTSSAYLPYPGFAAPAGALGEYNGKFMINQMVLRGGSIATPAGHTRPTYRNFFHPDKRWQFSGVRLAAAI